MSGFWIVAEKSNFVELSQWRGFGEIAARGGFLGIGLFGAFLGFWLAVCQFETRGMWLASRWGGGLLLCMRCGYGSIRFEDWLLVAAILVVGILMYK